MIKISSPEQQLRQNRNLLLLVGGIGSVAGLLLWSATPFALSSPKNKFDVSARYLSLLTTLGLGVATVVAGSQLERIKPLIKALDMAEKNDFLTQLASSQYQQELHWQQLASQPLQQGLLQDTYQLTHNLPENCNADTASTSRVSNQVSSSATGVTAEDYRSLFHSIILLKQAGVSDTKIIETVLRKGGKYFDDGKAMLGEILALGNDLGWDKE